MDEMNERVVSSTTWAHLLESSPEKTTVHNSRSMRWVYLTNDTLVSISTPPLQLHI